MKVHLQSGETIEGEVKIGQRSGYIWVGRPPHMPDLFYPQHAVEYIEDTDK